MVVSASAESSAGSGAPAELVVAEKVVSTAFQQPLTLFEGCLVDAPSFGELRLRQEQLVAVDAAGRIVALLGATDRLSDSALHDAVEAARSAGRVRRLEQGQWLLPGFVDCHIHAPQYSYTGTGLDLPLMGPDGWLERYTFPAERCLGQNPDEARLRYKTVVSQTLRRGTTTALYFATLHLEPTKALADTADELGQRALIGKVSMDRHSPADYQLSVKENLADTEAFLDYVEAKCSARISAVVTPRFVPTCSRELLEGLGALAARRECRVQTHAAESGDEVSFCRALHPEQPRDARLLNDTGLMPGPGRTVLAHGVHLSDEELDLLASKGAAVAHCPLSNAYFANGVFRVREALKKGVRVGLGTDVAGGYDPSMLSALRAAMWSSRLLQSGVACYDVGEKEGSLPLPQSSRRDNAAIDHAEALWLATLGGAAALGLEQQIGSFAVGKDFDALLVDVRAADSPIDTFPEDSASDLVQKFLHLGDDRNILAVFVQGRAVVQRPPGARCEVIGSRRGQKRPASH